MAEMFGRAEFRRRANVSRETLEKFDAYAGLLVKWSSRINLISKSTVSDLWLRHFLDSAQLFDLTNLKAGHWVDVGSGGGFPGLVMAIIAQQNAAEFRFTLVESDTRKAVFLQTVARELSLKVTVISDRIEKIPPLSADVLSARALASLPVLLGYAHTHLKPTGQALLMKGANFRQELEDSLEYWTFQRQEYTSKTDGAAVILSLGDIRRV